MAFQSQHALFVDLRVLIRNDRLGHHRVEHGVLVDADP